VLYRLQIVAGNYRDDFLKNTSDAAAAAAAVVTRVTCHDAVVILRFAQRDAR